MTGHWQNAFEFCQGKCRTHQHCTEHENAYIDDRHFCFSDTGRPQVRSIALPLLAAARHPGTLQRTQRPAPGAVLLAQLVLTGHNAFCFFLVSWHGVFVSAVVPVRTHACAAESITRRVCMQTAPLQPLPDRLWPLPGSKGQSCTAACAAHNTTCDEAALAELSSCDRLRDAFACEAGCGPGDEQPEAPSYIAYGVPKAHYPTMCWTLGQAEKPSCDASLEHAVRLCPCLKPGAQAADER